MNVELVSKPYIAALSGGHEEGRWSAILEARSNAFRTREGRIYQCIAMQK